MNHSSLPLLTLKAFIAPSSFRMQFSHCLFAFAAISLFMIMITISFPVLRALLWCYEVRQTRYMVRFIDAIPRVVYIVPSSSSSLSSPVSVVPPKPDLERCSICMEEFVNGEVLSALPRCKHLYHGMCIERWLLTRSRTCPVCRKLVI